MEKPIGGRRNEKNKHKNCEHSALHAVVRYCFTGSRGGKYC